EPCRDLLRGERDDVGAAPGEVLLKVGRVRRPHAIEAGGAIMSAVRGHGRVSALERRGTQRTIDRSAESTAGGKEELVVPLRSQRKTQLDLVLRRDEAGH